MTVDYDTRRPTEGLQDEPLAGLATREGPVTTVDVDDADVADYELPDVDLSGEEFVVRVLPQQPDEFTCTSCFLVQHRTRLAPGRNSICADCD